MSVFTPDSNIVKETINVNYSDRRSAQKVIFINRENEFYGTQKGVLDTTGGVVRNATLSNCNIVMRDGSKIYLDEINDKLDDLCVAIDTVSVDLVRYVDDRVSATSGGVGDLSAKVDVISGDVELLKQVSSGNLTLVGELSVLGNTSFKNIFTANGYSEDTVIKNGYMYMLRTATDTVVESIDVTDKDFIITKVDELSVKVKDVNKNTFMFVDAMDKNLTTRVSTLENQMTSVDTRIDEVNENMSILDSKVGSLSVEVGKIVDQDSRITTISTDLNDLKTREARHYSDSIAQIGRIRDIVDGVREDMDDTITALVSETATRASEDADIRTNLKLSVDNLLSGQGGDVSKLVKKINDEISARQEADVILYGDLTALSERLDEEISRATGVEDELSGKVDDSLTAITKLTSDLEAEKTARESKDEELETSIVNNFNTLTALVRGEAERAEAEEVALGGRIDNALTSISALDTKLTNEIARATNRENELDDAITAVVSSLNDVKEELEEKIASEVTRSKGVEDIISGKVDDALTAITALDADLDAEVARARAKEDELEEKIGGGYGDLTALLAAEIVTRASEDQAIRDDLLTAVTDLESKISSEKVRAENAEDYLSGRIDDSLTAVNSLSEKIETETARAKGVEDIISADLVTTKKTLIGSIDYKGHVKTDKYGTTKVDLSSIFSDYLSTTVYTFKNGYMYWFTNESGTYETKDGLKIKDKDYVLIHSHTDISTDLSEISPDKVDIISHNGNNLITKEDLDAVEAELNTAIAAEKSRAESVESELSGKVDDALTAITSLESNLNAEVARAKAKEDELEEKIGGGYGDLTALLVAETNRAKGVESVLSGKIDDALTAMTDMRSDLTALINTEKIRAESAEGALDTKIDGVYEDVLTALEEIRDDLTATSTALDGKITTEKNRAEGIEDLLSDAIDDTNAILDIVSDRVEEKVVLNKNFDPGTGTFKNIDNIQSFQVVQLSTIEEYSEVSSTMGILSNAIYLVNEDTMTEYQKTVGEKSQTAYNYLSEKVKSGLTMDELVTSLLPVLSSLANIK